MSPQEFMEARNSFIGERIAVIMELEGKDEKEAMAEAKEQWEKYCKCIQVVTKGG